MTYTVGGLRLDQPFRIRRIGHFGYHSPEVAGTFSFLTDLLGLKPSDVDDFTSRVPQLPREHATGYFLRCGTDHHTVVLGSQMLVDTREPARKGSVVGQISWQVGSLQEVVDGTGFLDKNARIRRVGRDAPGSNWHAYAYDPDGYIHEIFYGMEQIGWDGRSKPASMYDRAFHETPELPQVSEASEVDSALARGDDLVGFRNGPRAASTFAVEGILMDQPFKITRLGRIVLYVQDLEASIAFYTGILGLKVSERFDVDGLPCAFLRAEGEHHTLALYPSALRTDHGCAAGIGFAVASYQQLRDAYRFLVQKGVRVRSFDPRLSPGVHYGFWVQGPDQVAIQLYYGMDRVNRDGSAPSPTTFPTDPADWPDSIEPGAAAWDEPPFLGPLA